MEEKIAIIDLGSNSVRMIVMKIFEDQSYKMIDNAKEMVRLSEGMGKDNILKPDAIERTLHALNIFKKVLDIHKVDTIYALATAAVRNARNSDKFLKKVLNTTGLDFKVITGEEEAHYDYLGVMNTVAVDNCILIDTGGGSTELILVKNRQAINKISLPYGAVNLFERFSNKGEWNNDNVKDMENFIAKEFAQIPWLNEYKDLQIVGLGGSVRALAKNYKKKQKLNLEGLHNVEIQAEEVLEICNIIAKATLEERREMPGIGKERADICVSGITPLKVLFETVKAKNLIVSGNGLREGVFYSHYNKKFFGNELLPDILTHSINNVLKNYDSNEQHCQLVEKLALQMFDQLKSVHKMDIDARRLVSSAGLLHDIGMYVDYYNHHQHGFYLTMNSKIYGLTNREVVMCAFMVAMHRNEDFKLEWKEYASLISKADYEMAKKLSVFVRLAEELDRTEVGIVHSVECVFNAKQVSIKLRTSRSAELEKAVAMQGEKVFEKAFNRKLVIE